MKSFWNPAYLIAGLALGLIAACASPPPPDLYQAKSEYYRLQSAQNHSTDLADVPRVSEQFYVQCPMHKSYCFKKSSLLCPRGYRTLTMNTSANPPEMLIECH